MAAATTGGLGNDAVTHALEPADTDRIPRQVS
jgi:hypothetical protein